MRNLPQTVTQVSYKSDGQDQFSDDSPYNTVCPQDWPLTNTDSIGRSHSNMAHSKKLRTVSEFSPNSQPTPMNDICSYLAEHRVRLLFTFISLVFLALFLLVIYRQFGLIAFASILSFITVPVVFVLVYAYRLKCKEQHKAIQKANTQSNLKTSKSKQEVFSTDVEIGETQSFQRTPRKTSQQKIKIQLPPTMVDD